MLTPSRARKSASRNLNGMFETWSLVGPLLDELLESPLSDLVVLVVTAAVVSVV